MSEFLLRLMLPLAAACATAWFVDLCGVRRRLQPPGFVLSATPKAHLRRTIFQFVFSVGLFLTVFQSVAMFGVETEVDLSQVSTWQLFWVHGVLIGILAAWYVLGFSRTRSTRGRFSSEWLHQFGLIAQNVGKEVLIGTGAGVVGWVGVLAVVSAVGMAVTSLGGVGALPQEVPPQIVWMASLSLPVRVLIATSAGVVEEVFFRGFLQPRVGIPLSTVLFVLAHMSYGEPFLLVGITLLSVGFSLLAKWRGSIWAAITAHFFFDAIQLLVLIPAALEVMG